MVDFWGVSDGKKVEGELVGGDGRTFGLESKGEVVEKFLVLFDGLEEDEDVGGDDDEFC